MYFYRVSKENRTFGGLWYGCAKPDMTLFLKPMSQSLRKLSNEGKYYINVMSTSVSYLV